MLSESTNSNKTMKERNSSTEGNTQNYSEASWQFWIDVGGTFTDCIARRPDGSINTCKILSSGIIRGRVKRGSNRSIIVDLERQKDPDNFYNGYKLTLLRQGSSEESGRDDIEVLEEGIKIKSFDRDNGSLELEYPLSVEPQEDMIYELFSGEEAPLTGIRWLKGLRLEEPVGEVQVRLGTTRGTNALLEKKGAYTALVTSEGFGDSLKIGYQDRPNLFKLDIKEPVELYSEVVELKERLDETGKVIVPLSKQEVRDKLLELKEKGIDSLAICLMNSYKSDVHERMVTEVAKELGFRHFSSSSGLVPLQRIVTRGDTTVVDAYLTPVIRDYARELQRGIPDAELKMMTNAGGLVEAESYSGKDSILSGPAGGVVGCARVAQQENFSKAIGFDMGGTSTDVSRFDGDYEYRFEMEMQDPDYRGGVKLVSPMLWIETVAAGGGSICWFDGQLPRVGPHSASADPGPACYGRGGPLTVTDVNLYLGRILPSHFAFPLDLEAVENRLDEIIWQMKKLNQDYTREELAEGFMRIANSTIAAAIRKISVARGYDVRDYVLVGFGGAGPQHACPVARELGMETILFHPFGSILSAYGIGMADVKKFAEKAVNRIYSEAELNNLEKIFKETEHELYEAVLEEGVPAEYINPPHRMLDLRYKGQEWTLTISRPSDGDYKKAFEEKHKQVYGFSYPERELEIYAIRVEVTGETEKPQPQLVQKKTYHPSPDFTTPFRFEGGKFEAGVFQREQLSPGDIITGPAIVIEKGSTIVIDPGWEAELDKLFNLILKDKGSKQEKELHEEKDLITLELFNNAFSSIAGQMGATLQKVALSTNVKERRDFSCAVFTAEGELVANAPHIPVHLGAMPASVKHILDTFPDIKPGEVYITNDPYRGGSHLPDVTVVTPVFDRKGENLLFFTANRAHHAEIGGITPGSMPPFAKNLAEEGVVIRAFRFVGEGRAGEKELKRILSEAPYPTRALRENIADIYAQVAANQTGAFRLLELVDNFGLDVVRAYMGHIQDAAENMMLKALLNIEEGTYEYTDYMDEGTPISVKILIKHSTGEDGFVSGEAWLDFEGTGSVMEGSLNANPAIVSSAVLYCFRSLIDEDIPLNAGVMKPLNIQVPEGSLLNPPAAKKAEDCPAVAGGNVETSQRVVDVIFGALGVAAASQGTMNNISFGRAATSELAPTAYYETLGGGVGAGKNYNGTSGVHSHMTNTRITDPEVVEARYPVRVKNFALRKNSGGKGTYSGGDGLRREIEFLEPLEVSLLTGRRTSPPYGLNGGTPGSKGRNYLIRAGNGEEIDLGWAAVFEVDNGDLLVIETPGGGGCG